MIKQHLHYTVSDNLDATLWRYLDISKLESLLKDSALYFRRSDKFSDDHEGSYSDPAIADRPRFFEGAEPHFIEKGLPEIHRTWAKCTYVNCWFIGDHESLAMWKLYGKVAIRSSISNLKKAIKGEEEFCLGPVSYIDYEKDMMSQANAFSPFFHKRKIYQHEAEFRILTFLEKDIGRVQSGEIIPSDGVLINVNVEELIDSIVIFPEASNDERKEIKDLIEKYNLSYKLKDSILERKPKF